MNIFLIVIIYALNANGDFTKTTYETTSAVTMEQCELAANVAKKDHVLNNDSSYVFSAHCELRKKAK